MVDRRKFYHVAQRICGIRYVNIYVQLFSSGILRSSINFKDGLQSWQALYQVSPEKSEADLEVFVGKSVLCSTAINCALRRKRSDREIGVAFFYFTFNDNSKQDESAMLRALLLQLSDQVQNNNGDLTALHKSNTTGVPSSLVLIDYLKRVIQRFRHVYILLDALDESPRNVSRERVLDTLEKMRNWNLQCLHLLVTSRDERDIRESFDLSPVYQTKMQNSGIDKDIMNFISGRLDTDRRLKSVLPYRERVQESLVARAKGM